MTTPSDAAALDRARQALLLVVVTVSGGAVLVLELCAGRLFAPWFGMSQPVWTNVIGVALAALAAGYALGGRLASRGATLRAPAVVLLVAGALAMAAAHVGPVVAAMLLPAGTDLEGVAGLLVRSSLLATLLVFGPPMVLLGMVGPLAVHLLAVGREAGRAAGWVLALSTAGSIAGTFLTTHWLLPSFGTRASVSGSGAVLAGTGVALLIGAAGRARVAGAAAVLVATAGAFAAAPGGAFRAAEMSGVVVLAETESAYQFIQVREGPDAGADAEAVTTRFLTLNEGRGTYHSVYREDSVLTGGRYYDTYPALPLLLGKKPGDRLRVAILGFAGGTQARALRHFHGENLDLEIVGAEIDPQVVEVAREHLGLPANEPGLDVHVLDARVLLRVLPAEDRFDLILVDCYSQEYYLPFHLVTEEFFREARDRLTEGGLLVYNAFTYAPDSPLLRTLENTTAKVFGRIHRMPIPGYPNYVVMARRLPDDLGDRERHERFPPFEDVVRRIDEGGYDWLAERPDGGLLLERASSVFAAAMPWSYDPEGAVFTDDRAPVERLIDDVIRDVDRLRLGDGR